MNANLQWLVSKWQLPEAAIPAVSALMLAEVGGSTALRVDDPTHFHGPAFAQSGSAANAPLVLLQHHGDWFVQSNILHEIESTIAQRILRAAHEPVDCPPDLELKLAQLFQGAGADSGQARAALVAVSRPISWITGGPGTGKTYTLARILALLLSLDTMPSQIFLAAPTGKAAQRMKSAVLDSLSSLPASVSVMAVELRRVAERCSTLHSLLRWNPASGTYASRKLPSDAVLIVDECSMMDVFLWHAVLSALPDDGRLVLLGDPNQLESVGQGNVFSELARCAANPPLDVLHVHLTEARRFRDRPDILRLAKALESSNADATAEVLSSCRSLDCTGGLAWIQTATSGSLACDAFPPRILQDLQAVANADTPEAALGALDRICILTAQRGDFVGARAVSSAIENYLSTSGPIRHHPIIINQNDPSTGLRNGSVGVISIDANGARSAWFRHGASGLQQLSLIKLPDYSPAWAITIHRSQGSEYEDVLVIVPRADSPLANRELLYTAITRASRSVFVAGDLDAIRSAAATSSTRTSLLAAHFARAEYADCG